jgi:hypothetical protein
VFSSFGPGNTYNGAAGVTVGDGAIGSDAGFSYATYFTAALTTPLESIVLGATHCGTNSFCGGIPPRDPNSNAVIMSLYDNGATGGGTLLESITVTGQMQPWRGQTNAIVTGVSVLQPLLTAGTTYWLVASEPNPLTDATVWGFSIPGLGTQTYFRDGNGPWTGYSSSGLGFQINGVTPVPEPSMGLLTGITGLIGLGGALWRRSHHRSSACSSAAG